MTTIVQSPIDTDPSYDDDHADSSVAPASTALEPAVATAQAITGDIVTGPLHLNLESPDLPPIRVGRLDPRQLLDNPRNPRKSLGDLSDLTTSIGAFGVLVPLVVIATPTDNEVAINATDTGAEPAWESGTSPGTPINELTAEQFEALLAPDASPEPAGREQFVIFMGHRRKHAAIEVGRAWVPCWIVSDEGAARQIMGMVLENSHREGLTPTEEAEAYHQLTLEGWSAEDIAAVRAVPTSAVNTALRARELPGAAQRALDKGTLTLDQALALEEFKDSPRANERLQRELDDQWRFKQALASERDKRDYSVAKERAKATLVLDGVKATGKPSGFGYDSPAMAADDLVDADGNALDVEQVKKLPGFAAFVEKVGSQARTVVYCEDAAAHGYTKRPKPTHYGMSAEQATARAEKEQREAEQREQLLLAAGVRHEFLQATYGSAKSARKLYLDALRAAVTGQSMNRRDLDDLYKSLGGSDADVLATAGEDRLRRSLVARWVCWHETNLAYTAQVYQYNLNEKAAVDWYDRLIAEGYPLTDAERAVYESLTEPDTDEEDEDTDEDEDGYDTGEQEDNAGGDSDETDNDGVVDSAADPSSREEEQPDGDTADADTAELGTVELGTADADTAEIDTAELGTADALESDAVGVDDGEHPVHEPDEVQDVQDNG